MGLACRSFPRFGCCVWNYLVGLLLIYHIFDESSCTGWKGDGFPHTGVGDYDLTRLAGRLAWEARFCCVYAFLVNAGNPSSSPSVDCVRFPLFHYGIGLLIFPWYWLLRVQIYCGVVGLILSCFGHARAKKNFESSCWLELCSPFHLGLSPCCLYLLHRAVNYLFYCGL